MDMFTIYAENLRFNDNVDLPELARMTEGYSGGDIRDLFQSTHLKVVRSFFQHGRSRIPTLCPTRLRWRTSKPSSPREDQAFTGYLERYHDWDESFKAS